MKTNEQLNVRIPADLHMRMKLEAVRNGAKLQDLVRIVLAWGADEIDMKTASGKLLLNELDGEDAASQKPVAVEKPRASISHDDLPRVPATGANPANFFRAPNPDGDAPLTSVRGGNRGQAHRWPAAGVHSRTQIVCEPVC